MRNLKFTIVLLFLSMFFGSVINAQDWPNLARYREENVKIGIPANGENRVVFMGNSITEGWGPTGTGYFAGKPYINRGISGQTTPQMLLRFRQDVIDLKPAVVVIEAGTNDIAGNTGPETLEMIKDYIISMAQLAKANQIKVVLCSLLPVFDYPWKPGIEPAEKIFTLNTMLKKYADENKIVYLDYYTHMVDDRKGFKAELSGDGVHPNKNGYAIMFPLVEAAITKAISL